jgi:uncharacterized protein YbaP (TraB family)
MPDLMAGKQPLDIQLYTRATEQGKTTGGLETVDEQLAYFDALTEDEQVRMLRGALDELEAARAAGGSLTGPLVEAYLSGDTRALEREMTRNMEQDRELKTKFLATVLTGRNVILADRIAATRAANPGKRCFFAVGALHLAGADGIPARLESKGLRTTRVTAGAAQPSLAEPPAAR